MKAVSGIRMTKARIEKRNQKSRQLSYNSRGWNDNVLAGSMNPMKKKLKLKIHYDTLILGLYILCKSKVQ